MSFVSLGRNSETNESHPKETSRTGICLDVCVTHMDATKFFLTGRETDWCLTRLIKIKQSAREWKFELKS